MTDVAIVIATRDRASILRDALASLDRLSPAPAEVVVVDCGSKDETREVVSAAGSSLIECPIPLASAARNAGAAASVSPYLGFLDSDDLALSAKTSELAGAMDRDDRIAMAHGMVEVIDRGGSELLDRTRWLRGQIEVARDRGTRYEQLASGCLMYTSATLIRRSAFEEVGGYDGSLETYEDWDLYLRLSRVGELIYVDAPAARYRMWEGNVPWDRTARGMIRVARKHLEDLGSLPEPARRAAEFGFRARIAGSAYTLLDMRTARSEAVRALALDPGRAIATKDVRRALSRSWLPGSLLAWRRPAAS